MSVGAASTALRNVKSSVVLSQATRARIIQAAKELRYRPYAAARVMAGQRLQTIGILATEFCMMGSYWSTVMRGVATTVNRSGYHLMLKTVPDKLDMRKASFFAEQQIDGVVIPAETESQTRDALHHFDIPHVWVNTKLREPTNCVHPDEYQGMRLAIDHLYELGHRRIAYMHHTSGEVHHTTVERERGYVMAMQARGLEPIPTYERYMNVPEHADVYADMTPRPTAVVVFSDAMAILAMNRFQDRGLRVPDDISVVGNEGIIWHEYAYRPLTTVKAPAYELGETAVKMLIRQIENNESSESVVLPQTLIVQESTAPPPPNA